MAGSTRLPASNQISFGRWRSRLAKEAVFAAPSIEATNMNGKRPESVKSPVTIAIAGGGIAGLALAVGLLKHGIDVAIYEAAPAFAEIGAGVGISPNSRRAIELLSDNLYQAYLKGQTINAWPELRDSWFTFRHGQREDRGEQNIITKVSGKNAGMTSVHRAHLLDEMVSLVPEGVARFGKRVVNVKSAGWERAPGGGALLEFADGTTATADAVVGCDGIKSVTRQVLLGKDDVAATPTFTGKYAYRGLIPMDKAIAVVGEEEARNSQMYIGHDGHVLTFPIEKGKTMNVVAFRTKKDGKWEDEKWVKHADKEELMREYAGWNESVRAIVELIEKPDIWALFDYPPAHTYVSAPDSPPLLLHGDAAHASTPHQGAGAGMAFEDAYLLSNLLSYVKNPGEIEAAFRAFDIVRRPRTQKLVSTSREAGMLYEFQVEGIGDDLDKLCENLHTRYKWIWEEDLEGQLDSAKELLGKDLGHGLDGDRSTHL